MRRFIKGFLGLFLIAIIAVFAWGYAPDVPVAELKAKYANSESEFVDLGNGLVVHLRDEGPKDAPAIILLHGSNASLQTWDEWTKRLKGQYRIIRYDQAGHGITGPHPKDDYSAAAFVKVVDQIAANRGLSHFTLAGNSMGGWVAYEYAKAHPDKLDGLILVDAAGAPDATPKKLPIGFRIMQIPVINKLATVITPRAVVEKSLHESVSRDAFITPAEVDLYWNMLRRPGNRDATLKRFSARKAGMISNAAPGPMSIPTLILWGKDDTLIPVKSAQWFEKIFPDHVTHIYQGTGHLPMQEVAEQSARDVAAWMGRDRSSSTPKALLAKP